MKTADMRAYRAAYRLAHRERLQRYRAQRADALSAWYLSLKGEMRCAVCGERPSHPDRLHLHHPPSVVKVGQPGTMCRQMRRKSLIWAEIQKCVPVCVSCHFSEHQPHRGIADDTVTAVSSPS